MGVEVFQRRGSYAFQPKDLDVPLAIFVPADLSVFCGLDELGLVAVRQVVGPDRAVIECRVVEPDGWSFRCGAEGIPRGSAVRRHAHLPFGMRPTPLLVSPWSTEKAGWLG